MRPGGRRPSSNARPPSPARCRCRTRSPSRCRHSLTDVLSGPPLQGQRLVVHPLGGCPMGDDCTSGVVDQYGAVYDGRSPRTVHDSLFVWDGSIVPMSLGANPFLTITALAERAVDHVLGRCAQAGEAQARSRGQDVAAAARAAARRLPAPRAFDDAAAARVPIALRETLRGRLALAGSSASRSGIAAVLKLRMEVPDMLALLQGAGHRIDKVGGEFRWALPGAAGVRRARHAPPACRWCREASRCWSRCANCRLLRIVRGLWAWWRKRGSQESGALLRDLLSGRKPWRSLLTSLWLAERAGTRRQFRYAAGAGAGAAAGADAERRRQAEAAISLHGVKTVRFATDSNVWESLLDLPVMVRRGRDRVPVARGVLRLDLVDFADRGAPQILGHADAPNGLLAIAGLPLLFLRVILATHLWDFRAPDYRRARARRADTDPAAACSRRSRSRSRRRRGPRTSRSQRHSLAVPWSLRRRGAAGRAPAAPGTAADAARAAGGGGGSRPRHAGADAGGLRAVRQRLRGRAAAGGPRAPPAGARLRCLAVRLPDQHRAALQPARLLARRRGCGGHPACGRIHPPLHAAPAHHGDRPLHGLGDAVDGDAVGRARGRAPRATRRSRASRSRQMPTTRGAGAVGCRPVAGAAVHRGRQPTANGASSWPRCSATSSASMSSTCPPMPASAPGRR